MKELYIFHSTLIHQQISMQNQKLLQVTLR